MDLTSNRAFIPAVRGGHSSLAATRFAFPNPAGTKVYGIGYGFNEVSIVSATTNLITGSIPIPFAGCNGQRGGTFN